MQPSAQRRASCSWRRAATRRRRRRCCDRRFRNASRQARRRRKQQMKKRTTGRKVRVVAPQPVCAAGGGAHSQHAASSAFFWHDASLHTQTGTKGACLCRRPHPLAASLRAAAGPLRRRRAAAAAPPARRRRAQWQQPAVVWQSWHLAAGMCWRCMASRLQTLLRTLRALQRASAAPAACRPWSGKPPSCDARRAVCACC